MNKTVRFSPMNWVKFVQEGHQLSEQYGFPEYGHSLYLSTLQPWDAHAPYFIKMQYTDVVQLQFSYSVGAITIGGARLEFWDETGMLHHIPAEAKTTVTAPDQDGNPMVAEQYIFSPGGYDQLDGKQFIWLKVHLWWLDDTQEYYLSEPIWLRDKHPNTVLLSYSNKTNDYDTNFEQFVPLFRMRVPSLGLKMKVGGESTVFENQVGENVKLYAQTVRNYTWDVGGKTGIPDYMIDRISHALDCDNFSIDGKLYTKEEGAVFEAVSEEGAPLQVYTILLREGDHQSSYTHGERDILLWERPATGYPYAMYQLVLSSWKASIISEPIVFEDAGTEAGYIAALNLQRIAYQMEGIFEEIDDKFYYRMALGEDFTANRPTIYSKVLYFTADVNGVGPTAFNFRYSFRAGSHIFSPVNGEAEFYTDPSRVAVTVQHRYNVNTLTEVYPRIFHNDTMLNFGYNGVGASGPFAVITHKIKNITGDASAWLQSWDMFNANFSDLASLSLEFLFPCRSTLQIIRMERCGITALTAGWGTSSSFLQLVALRLNANTFNSSAVDDFFIELSACYQQVAGLADIRTLAGTNPPTATSATERGFLTNSNWVLMTD